MGTPSYMSPEQARGDKLIGPATDIWALGAILYRVTTGRLPFLGSNAFETIKQVIETETVPPRTLVPNLPRDLETIRLKCLRKETGRRYASANELAEDLRRFAEGRPIQARPVGNLERGWKWMRRRPSQAAGAVGGLLVVVGVLVGWAFFTGKVSRERDRALTAETAEKKRSVELNAAVNERETALINLNKALDEKDTALVFSERSLANTRILNAESLWMGTSPVQASQAQLQSIPAKYRQWEWRYLNERFRADLLTCASQREPVKGVAINADGSRFASASLDGTVQIWDGRNGASVLRLRGHQEGVIAVAMTADGRRVVSGSWDRTLRVWDGFTGELLYVVPLKQIPDRVAISADGSRIVTAERDRTMRIWNGHSGELQFTFATAQIKRLAVNADGSLVAALTDGATGLLLWNGRSGEPLAWSENDGTPIFSLAMNQDGSRVATSTLDYQILIRDARTGRVLQKLKCLNHIVVAVAMNAAGDRVAAIAGDSVRIWNTNDSLPVVIHKGFRVVSGDIALSADGTRAATVSEDGSVRLWHGLSEGNALELKGPSQTVVGVATNWDGSVIVGGSFDGFVRFWDGRSGLLNYEFQAHPSGLRAIAVDEAVATLATGSADGSISLWDTATGKRKRELTGNKSGVVCLAISRDGRRVVSGCENYKRDQNRKLLPGPVDCSVRVWDAETGVCLREFRDTTTTVSAVAINRDGSHVYAWSYDQRLWRWNVATGEKSADVAESYAVHAIALDASEKHLAVAGVNGSVAIRDPEMLEIRTDTKSTTVASSVRFGDGAVRLVVGDNDSRIHLFDTQTAQKVLELKGHTEAVTSVAVSGDDSRIVSGSADRTVLVWDAPKESVDLRKDEQRNRWRTRPDPDWHVEQQKKFAEEKNAYAAALHRSFEQQARGVVAFDYNQFDKAYAHFIAAALLKLPVPKAVEIEPKK